MIFPPVKTGVVQARQQQLFTSLSVFKPKSSSNCLFLEEGGEKRVGRAARAAPGPSRVHPPEEANPWPILARRPDELLCYVLSKFYAGFLGLPPTQ